MTLLQSNPTPTLEEFLKLPETKPAKEYINGKIYQKPMPQGLANARGYYLVGREVDIETATKRSHAVLKVIDRHLQERQWLELNRPTIADIACFPYVAMASDGKIALVDYQNIVAWLDRIKQLSGYLDLPQ